jgi:hypothetical protein
MTMVKRIHDMAFTSWPHHVRSMFLRLRIVSWRFRAIMAVHIAFLNESMNLVSTVTPAHQTPPRTVLCVKTDLTGGLYLPFLWLDVI